MTKPPLPPHVREVNFDNIKAIEWEISNNHPKLGATARFLAHKRGAPGIETEDRIRSVAFWHEFLELVLDGAFVRSGTPEKPPFEPTGDPPAASIAWARKYLDIT